MTSSEIGSLAGSVCCASPGGGPRSCERARDLRSGLEIGFPASGIRVSGRAATSFCDETCGHAPQPSSRPGAIASRIGAHPRERIGRSEEHTSELQSLMRTSYAVFCLKNKKTTHIHTYYIDAVTL